MNKPIQVGTLVEARKASGVCDVGERGVCYEVYELGGRPGYGILFESGRHDGFSPEEVEMFLHVSDTVVGSLAGYEFRNVGQLMQDFRGGHFADAFGPRFRSNGHGRHAGGDRGR